MTIHKKLVFAMVSIAILSMGAYLLVASWQSQRQSESARRQIKQLVDSSTVDTSAALIRLIAAQDEALRKQVESELNVARDIVQKSGPVTLSTERVHWKATNQFSHRVTDIVLPKMLFGGKWLGQNSDPNVRTPIIDDEHRLVGGTMTVFQRVNAAGDMLRVATNVEMAEGSRPVGTFIPHIGPNGRPNKVIQAVLEGKTYRGVAWVVHHYYVACYEPLRDRSGNLIGAIYTGERQENGPGLREAIMKAQVGLTGKIVVLSAKGSQAGKCLMSQDRRDGADLMKAVDADGFPYVSQLVHVADKLKDGQSAIVRYTLAEAGGRADITARVANYRPWNWIVVTEAHPQDFAEVYEKLYNSGNATLVAFFLICCAMVLLTLPLLWADANDRARREAERASLAKSEFLSRMSHELRTPLNAILGFAQILQMDDLTEDQRDSISHVHNAGQHLLKLINEVLDMSRIESGALLLCLEPVALHTVGSEVRALLHPLAEERDITLEVDFSPSEPMFVVADKQRLTQVLINLVSNAIKYNRELGWVRITSESASKGFLRIKVTDTGSGIPSDRIKDLFTPFDRLGAETTNVEGTGLGLALSKHLVEQMGGNLSFETGSSGTSFYVDLPEAEEPASKTKTDQSA
jgi:signal transduction histidine kinase